MVRRSPDKDVVIPDSLTEAVAAQDGLEASAQPGPRIEIHREADDSLHVILRCPERPTEIMSVLRFEDKSILDPEHGFVTETVQQQWDVQVRAWIERHVLLAACDCAEYLDDALDEGFATGMLVPGESILTERRVGTLEHTSRETDDAVR